MVGPSPLPPAPAYVYPPYPPSPPPSGAYTRAAVERIRSGLGLYWVALLLQFLILLASFGVVLLTGVPSYSSLPGVSGSAGGATLRPAGNAAAVLGLSGIIVLLAISWLVLVIVAWLRWREGTRQLEASAHEYPAPHPEEARAARGGVQLTTAMFLVWLLASIVLAVAVALVAFSGGFHCGMGSNATCTFQAVTGGPSSTLQALVIFAGILGALLPFLLYLFATRSLTVGIFSIARPELQAQLTQARQWVLAGMLLNFLTVLGVVNAYASGFGVIAVLIVVLGYYRYRQAYDAWLGSPVVPMATLRVT